MKQSLRPNAGNAATVLISGAFAVAAENGVSFSVANMALMISAASLLLQYATRFARLKGWIPEGF